MAMIRASHNLAFKGARVIFFSLVACLLLLNGESRGEPGNTAAEQGLDNLISVYFSSWSQADMQAYKDCFHPLASVGYLDKSGNLYQYQLEEFLTGQARAHQTGPKPLTEKPTKITRSVQGRLGQAEVRWQLQQGSATATGTDYFIFVKTEAGWKIISLVYEQDKRE